MSIDHLGICVIFWQVALIEEGEQKMDKPRENQGSHGNDFVPIFASFDTVHALPRYQRASHNDRPFFFLSRDLGTCLIGSAFKSTSTDPFVSAGEGG